MLTVVQWLIQKRQVLSDLLIYGNKKSKSEKGCRDGMPKNKQGRDDVQSPILSHTKRCRDVYSFVYLPSLLYPPSLFVLFLGMPSSPTYLCIF